MKLVSFWRYGKVNNVRRLMDVVRALPVTGGRVYVHREGINAMLMVSDDEHLRQVTDSIAAIAAQEPVLADLRMRVDDADDSHFNKLVVKNRALCADGLPADKHPHMGGDEAERGRLVSAQQWHEKLRDHSDDTLVLDIRNHYEHVTGTFEGAVSPKTEAFRETFEKLEQMDIDKSKKVMMFCTGGIRCAKVSAYMVQKMGHPSDQVFALEGGIDQYLREYGDKEDRLFHGENFSFHSGNTATSPWYPGEKSAPQEPSMDVYLRERMGVSRSMRKSLHNADCGDRMVSGAAVGGLLRFLMPDHGTALDLGCFTGYSALWLADSVGAKVISVEKDPIRAEAAIESLRNRENISVVNKDWRDVLPGLESDSVDLSFVDCNHKCYNEMLPELMRVVKLQGHIVFDNVLWRGEVMQSGVTRHPYTKATALDAFNRLLGALAAQQVIDFSLLPVRDGLALVRLKKKISMSKETANEKKPDTVERKIFSKD